MRSNLVDIQQVFQNAERRRDLLRKAINVLNMNLRRLVTSDKQIFFYEHLGKISS